MVNKGNLAKKKSCSHPVTITDENTGEEICNKCGEVLSGNQVLQKRRRMTGDEDYLLQRTGPPSSLRIFDKGLSTEMSSKKDYRGKSIGSEAGRMGRLRFWNARIKSKTTSVRTLRKALVQIESLRTKLSLPESVTEYAAKILRDAQKKRLAVGRNILLLAAASVYAACRANNIPRNLTEIAKIANLNRKSLSRMYRDVSSELDLKFEPFVPSSFIGKIASKLKIEPKIQREAIRILIKAEKSGKLTGKRPAALAAASLYLACLRNNIRTSQRSISEASKISQPTIKKLTKILDEI